MKYSKHTPCNATRFLSYGFRGLALATVPFATLAEYSVQAPDVTVTSPIELAENEAGEPSSFDDLFLDVPEESAEREQKAGDEDLPLSEEELFGTDTMFGAEALEDKPGIEGFLQSEFAYTYKSPTHPSKFRNILQLQSTGSFDNGMSWKASVRGAYDAVFELTDHYPDSVEDNRRFDGMLYENYVDASRGDLEFRVGRQNIIWGEMVGLFFADVVSAKDTRQFVAQDFDLIRIPQWAVRAEHFSGDFHTEAIWIPAPTYDEIGKPGDDFYPIQDFTPPPGFSTEIRAPEEPTRGPENSGYGLRFSFLKRGWDISTFYYRSVDAAPSFFRTIETGPNPRIVFTPKNKKIHQAAATLAKDFGQVVAKSEILFTKDRRVGVDNPNDADGLTKQDILDYVVSVEHTTPGNTLLNFQVYQRWYTNHESDIAFDEFETGAGVYTKLDVSSDVEAEFLFLSQFNRSDWMTRPRLNWTLTGNLQLQAGADIFGGDSIGLFGRFEHSSRVYVNGRYTF